MSKILPRELREPATVVAEIAEVNEIYGRVECSDTGMSFRLFYDQACQNLVIPPQEYLTSYQFQGWNIYPWNFDVRWNTCYALNGQNNIFIKVNNGMGLRNAL